MISVVNFTTEVWKFWAVGWAIDLYPVDSQ